MSPSEQTQWSVIDYIEDLQRHAGPLNEERRSKQFPPCGLGELEAEACVVVDVNGIILFWYLPGLLSPKRQVGINPSQN